ncbi:MAG: type I restriction endonuclease subunit R [Pseudomonadota bacterium]
MSILSEADVEAILLDHLARLGYTCLNDAISCPDGKVPERDAYSDVLLMKRFRAAVGRLNPSLPEDAREDAIRKVIAAERPTLIEENRRLHHLMTDGVKVEFRGDDGAIKYETVRLIDPDDQHNDWLAISQFTVIEGGYNRRPDVVVFLNGLPVGVIEVKKPGAENATLGAAYNQLQTYKMQIPSLFRTNGLLVTTDGILARVGSLTANDERFMPWRTTDGADVAPKGHPEMSVLFDGVFHRPRLLSLLRDFTVFGEMGSGTAKIIAGYHQFHAVKKAVAATVEASRAKGDRKVGVIWHTQGSGKSLLMAFYAGQLMREPAMENPTIVVITDRNDLDDQLYGTFSMCRDLIRQTPVQAESREDLQQALARASGGVVFTTIQKFAPPKGETYPPLTDRRNVIVVADEAHRSQYGFKARIEKSGDIAYGFAKYLRDALPNASFIGFTGTPIEQDDVNTPAVFGHYIDIYDISRAVEDGATVPIYYESRLARIELPDDEKPKLDADIADLTEDEAENEQERLKKKWSTVEALVGSEKRLEAVTEDLVKHFEARVESMDGKAMVVCMSRRICVAFYDALIKLRPDWHSDDDAEGMVKVVMTGSASDQQSWQPHIGGKARRDLLAKRAKDPNDALKLVIVRDMWLTGFDAPSMHTMYIDKPMKGHGLMQAIARVNRVFRDKPAGLVVDYIGIAQNLKSALGQYSGTDGAQTGIDEAEAVGALLSKLDVVRAMYHGFDYQAGLTGTPKQRLTVLAYALDWILGKQEEAAKKETDPEAQKRAHRRYSDLVLALSKAYAMAAASDAAKAVRDEVGFFQTVRAAMAKETVTTTQTSARREMAIRQLVDRAVTSAGIVDILQAAGMTTPDISILSDEFLAEVKNMGQKNLALEALKRLLNDEIRSRSKSNVTETRRFSERLEQAIARYHTNAISTVEVIQALIDLAKEIKEARARGEAEGMTPDELAFYDALADNDSAVQVMGNDQLKVVAHELLQNLQSNITIDWAHRDSARAKLRILVKRILRKYGYPPDLQDGAVQVVLQQAEVLSAKWAA